MSSRMISAVIDFFLMLLNNYQLFSNEDETHVPWQRYFKNELTINLPAFWKINHLSPRKEKKSKWIASCIYEKNSLEYISAADFAKELVNLGFKSRRETEDVYSMCENTTGSG